MILLTTVLMLGLLAVLMISIERMLWSYQKIHQQTHRVHQTFQSLQVLADKLSESIHHPKACVSDCLDVNEGLRRLASGKGCVMRQDNQNYYYWVNHLDSHQQQSVVTLQSVLRPNLRLILRFSKQEGLLSWRYLVD